MLMEGSHLDEALCFQKAFELLARIVFVVPIDAPRPLVSGNSIVRLSINDVCAYPEEGLWVHRISMAVNSHGVVPVIVDRAEKTAGDSAL